MRVCSRRRAAGRLPLFLGAALVLSCGGDSGSSPSPTPTNVVVTPGADTLISIGENQGFSATVLDANGDPIDGATVTWSSDAPGVVSINATNGVATAVANGSTHVKATAGAIEGSANVIVTQIVTSVTVTPGNAAFTSVGDTVRFTAVARDAGNTVVPGVQILWTVSDNTVATIDTLGLATAKGPGNALVSAQAQTRAGFAAIGVDPNVTQFAVLGAPTSGVAGDPLSTALQVELRDARGNRVMNSSLAVTVAPAGAATGTPLHGTTTLLADQGRATFTNLWFERAGADRLKVTVGALPVDSSSVVTVEPAAPAVVELAPVAPFQIAGVPIGLAGQVRDRFGNLALNYSGPVTATAIDRPPFGQFFGDSTTLADQGSFEFFSLNFHVATAPWRFTAFLPGTPTRRDTTQAMVVLAGPAATLGIAHLGSPSVALPAPDSTVLKVTDLFGNLTTLDSTIPFPYVQAEVTGWAYSSAFPYDQQVRSGAFADLIDGTAVYHIAFNRPGRARLIFTAPGLAPDTTEEIVPILPAPVMYGASGTFQSSVLLTDHATCLYNYISLCAGGNAHSELGVDPAAVNADSLFLSPDSTVNGNPASGDGGDRHLCVSVSDFFTGLFNVSCWGDNTEGQLGNGSVGGESSVPVTVGGFTSTVAPYISAGNAHTCAIFDGAAACWGKNDVGQLGIGTTGASTGTATAVTGGHDFAQISAGGRHTCAVDTAHALWCWGGNDFGQLGDSGVSGAYATDPIQVRPDLDWYSVAAGDEFTCGQLYGNGSTAQVYCWGRNDRKQFGYFDNGAPQSIVPRLAGLFNGSSNGISAGGQFVCAAFTGGAPNEALYCWGANEHGQLGRGTVSVADSMPVPPTPFAGGVGLEYVVPIVGRTHACALTAADPRKIFCWGENTDGRFGIGRQGGDEPTPLYLQDEY